MRNIVPKMGAKRHIGYMAKHPCFYGHLLLLPDYCQTLLEFLRPAGKQKLPISFGNQESTANCFSSKWCHQESKICPNSTILQ